MQPFKLYVLGCGSASPTVSQSPTAQVLQHGQKLFMIDCGEGTQVRLRRAKLSFERVGHIFISHLHGDHCFGLPGLIASMGLLGRRNSLHLHGPEALQTEFLPFLRQFCGELDFEIQCHVVDVQQTQVVYEDKSLTVTSFPLRHRVPCCGYLFTEKVGKRHINPEMTAFYDVPKHALNRLALGEDFVTPDGKVVPNDRLTKPPTPTRSYAYCSDTAYTPSLAGLLKGVDLLYHEATFATSDQAVAHATMHSTAAEAAHMATLAKAKKLLIGHYSARYSSPQLLVDEAKTIFPHTLAAAEGLQVSVGRQPGKQSETAE